MKQPGADATGLEQAGRAGVEATRDAIRLNAVWKPALRALFGGSAPEENDLAVFDSADNPFKAEFEARLR